MISSRSVLSVQSLIKLHKPFIWLHLQLKTPKMILYINLGDIGSIWNKKVPATLQTGLALGNWHNHTVLQVFMTFVHFLQLVTAFQIAEYSLKLSKLCSEPYMLRGQFFFSGPPAWTNQPGTGPGFCFPNPLVFSFTLNQKNFFFGHLGVKNFQNHMNDWS